MGSIDRLRDFVIAATRRIEQAGDVAEDMSGLLAQLIATDDWLPDDYTIPHPDYYSQYLLHADPLERFSVVCFVWGPGQKTPIHDHRIWGLVGVLRGAEISVDYTRGTDGTLIAGPEVRLEPGCIVKLSPETGDVHSIRNAFDDRVSISIHVYGANIGAVRRAVFDATDGREKPFISGYSNKAVPNLWDRSGHAR